MKQLYFFALVFLALRVPGASSVQYAAGFSPRGIGEKCLSQLANHSIEFQKCKERVCFLFLQEEPYVDLRGTLTSETDQRLFDCRNASATFPHLRGSAFKIHNELNVDALCVWGGSGCTFHDLTAFLSLRSETHPDHQFAITGMLLESPSRVTPTMYPAISILDSQLVIVGPQNTLDANLYPFEMLTLPFRRDAWVLFLIMVGVIPFFALLIVFVFMPNGFRLQSLVFHFMGETVEAPLTPTPTPLNSTDPRINSGTTWIQAASQLHQRRLSARDTRILIDSTTDSEVIGDNDDGIGIYKASVRLFQAAIGFLFVIFFLFYEISVVNVMIDNRSAKVPNIDRLSSGQLSKYTVLKSSGIEDIWRKIVDPYGVYNATTTPWHACENSSHCFDQILDKKHEAEFTVAFEHFARYEILKRNACKKLTIYSTDRGLYSFGAGWLFGNRVRNETVLQINENILQLRVKDKMQDLLDFGLKKDKCDDNPNRIGANVMAVAVLVPVGPFLLILTGILFFANPKRTS